MVVTDVTSLYSDITSFLNLASLSRIDLLIPIVTRKRHFHVTIPDTARPTITETLTAEGYITVGKSQNWTGRAAVT